MSAALRALQADGRVLGVFTDAPEPLARVALAQLGAGDARGRDGVGGRRARAAGGTSSSATRAELARACVDPADDLLDLRLLDREVDEPRPRRDRGGQLGRARLVAAEREPLARAVDPHDARAGHLERRRRLLEVDDERPLRP